MVDYIDTYFFQVIVSDMNLHLQRSGERSKLKNLKKSGETIKEFFEVSKIFAKRFIFQHTLKEKML